MCREMRENCREKFVSRHPRYFANSPWKMNFFPDFLWFYKNALPVKRIATKCREMHEIRRREMFVSRHLYTIFCQFSVENVIFFLIFSSFIKTRSLLKG
jgi:hypothetical protein